MNTLKTIALLALALSIVAFILALWWTWMLYVGFGFSLVAWLPEIVAEFRKARGEHPWH